MASEVGPTSVDCPPPAPEAGPTSTKRGPQCPSLPPIIERLKCARRFTNPELYRHPKPSNNLAMARFMETSAETEAEEAAREAAGQRPMDMIRRRPCTPNDQYTVMNKEMIQYNKDRARPGPIFKHEWKPWYPDKRYYMDRYATNTSQYLLRDPPRSSVNPYCWLDYQWWRYPSEDHNSNRFGASVKWGPSKVGCNTYSHFDGEDVYRYLNIDMYCRPPTNVMERVVSKFGRAPSYYHQRRPNTFTWFGSSHELNRTDVLVDIKPKPLDDYTAKWDSDKQRALSRKQNGLWPEYSEYTDRFLIRSTVPVKLSQIEQNKLHVAESRRQPQQE